MLIRRHRSLAFSFSQRKRPCTRTRQELSSTSHTTMNLRQKIQVVIILTLILFAFASFHPGTGSTLWLQWLTVLSLAAFVLVFDCAFTNDSQFIFDPDAENWRRKTVSGFALLVAVLSSVSLCDYGDKHD